MAEVVATRTRSLLLDQHASPRPRGVSETGRQKTSRQHSSRSAVLDLPRRLPCCVWRRRCACVSADFPTGSAGPLVRTRLRSARQMCHPRVVTDGRSYRSRENGTVMGKKKIEQDLRDAGLRKKRARKLAKAADRGRAGDRAARELLEQHSAALRDSVSAAEGHAKPLRSRSAKKASAKKASARKASAKKSSAKKASAKKSSAKKSSAKKASAKKSSAKTTSTKRAPARRSTSKSTTQKAPTKKAASGRGAATR